MAAGGSVMAFNPATLLGEAYTQIHATKSSKIKLGMDNFSIRGMGWKAPQILEYAASLRLDTVLLSDLDVYESLEEGYLLGIKRMGERLGVEIQAGTGSICPTSARFNAKYGSAEEHLGLLIRVAKTLGSPVGRCYLGSSADRQGDGGIYRHIESTVKVCKAVRNLALDSNVKIAIENHAGDMQAWELAELIEAAGKDYVGATMDAGNAVWTVEDPMTHLEILGPYAVTTGIRDSAVWESDNGASVAWTNMGDGHIDWPVYVKRFSELCPSVAFILEIISGGRAMNFPYLERAFWQPFPQARAKDFAGFVAMAKRGTPPVSPPDRPTGDRSEELNQRQQKYDLERSVKYCKETLGLGLK
jgi:sugar phosphate isomerase/epimerase